MFHLYKNKLSINKFDRLLTIISIKSCVSLFTPFAFGVHLPIFAPPFTSILPSSTYVYFYFNIFYLPSLLFYHLLPTFTSILPSSTYYVPASAHFSIFFPSERKKASFPLKFETKLKSHLSFQKKKVDQKWPILFLIFCKGGVLASPIPLQYIFKMAIKDKFYFKTHQI